MDLDSIELNEISITIKGVKRVFRVGDTFSGKVAHEEFDWYNNCTVTYTKCSFTISSIIKDYKGEIFIQVSILKSYESLKDFFRRVNNLIID